jgi:hypothetical protein
MPDIGARKTRLATAISPILKLSERDGAKPITEIFSPQALAPLRKLHSSIVEQSKFLPTV